MSQPAATARKPRLALAIWIGLALWVVTLFWWLSYYSQYGDWLERLGFKAVCIAVTTDDCVFMQKKLIQSAIPTYHPVLFWVGFIVIVLGFLQWHSRRA
jgi:hypothetical protein